MAGLAESARWSWRVSMVFRTKRAKVLAVGAVAGVAAALTVGLSAPSGATPTASQGRGGNHVRLDRVFIIVLENHSAKSVIGDPNTPYITSLAQQYGEAANYFGVTHPSEPNYIAMTSGSNWFTNNDNPANRFDHTNVVDTLEAAHIKPYTALAGDLNSPHAPRFVYITPDQCNDMHGGVNTAVAGHPETPCPFGSANDDANDASLKQKADAFVKSAVATIMSSRAWTPHSAIFIVADEGDFTGNAVNGGWDSPAGCCDSPVLPAGDPDISPSWPGGLYGGALVPAVVVDPSGPRHFVSNVAYNHYSMLRTIEDTWGLPELAFTSDHAQVATMNEFLAR